MTKPNPTDHIDHINVLDRPYQCTLTRDRALSENNGATQAPLLEQEE
jgi:hypothetical protein